LNVMMNRKEKGRALFYTRDSGGKHETTPGEYVGWAQRQAEQLELDFDGTPETIEAMIRNGQSAVGDLFLDFGVPGNILSRKGLDALLKTVLDDHDVSHVFTPRRNRLARPDHPMDGVKLEDALRRKGITLVFMDKTLAPMRRGKRPDIAELIVAAVDYDRSSEDRRELAQKVLYGQLRLAKMGFSTGGRPPFGFRRWLVKEDGTSVRELVEGEYVKRHGHHVVWLPGPEDEWAVIRRILRMLETTPAAQVARVLTAEGVRSPDSDRYRTDNGVRHRTSGVWHQTTIVGIARNPLLVALVEYGRRSMGDQLRCTPDGPRELADADFRTDENKPKVIINPDENRIIAPARFEAPVDPERHRCLLAKLDQRAGTQRGKPRSRDPNVNPLGGRVFDMNCGWPLYRQPYGNTYRYLCGLYQQSHGAQCAHNYVDGQTATRFLLSCVRQRALSPQRLQRLESRIRQLAAADQQDIRLEQTIGQTRAQLLEVETERDRVAQNLARAKNDEQYQAIEAIFDQLAQQAKSLRAEIAGMESQTGAVAEADSAVDIAMQIVRQLTELAGNAENLAAPRQIFDMLNARLFLGFHPVQGRKRTLNKICRGVVTFGDAKPAVEIYNGPTSRKKIKGPATSSAPGLGDRQLPSPPKSCVDSGKEDKSLGNVGRGERIRTFDFLLPKRSPRTASKSQEVICCQ